MLSDIVKRWTEHRTAGRRDSHKPTKIVYEITCLAHYAFTVLFSFWYYFKWPIFPMSDRNFLKSVIQYM